MNGSIDVNSPHGAAIPLSRIGQLSQFTSFRIGREVHNERGTGYSNAVVGILCDLEVGFTPRKWHMPASGVIGASGFHRGLNEKE